MRSPEVETSNRLVIVCKVFNMTPLYFTRTDTFPEPNLGLIYCGECEEKSLLLPTGSAADM